ncbi:MAG: Asp23/Gls24 family envelope stress response protein [Candidatus Howiella sp.]
MNPLNKSKTDLVISDEVFISIAGAAALEVAGVCALCPRPNNLKDVIVRATGGADGVTVQRREGEIVLDVSVKVAREAKIFDVAEQVQQNVKKAVQDMTGCAVARVNVHVSDVEIPAPAAEAK